MSNQTVQEQYNSLINSAKTNTQKLYIESCCSKLVDKCKKLEDKITPFKEINCALKSKKAFNDKKNLLNSSLINCVDMLDEFLSPGETFLENKMTSIKNSANKYITTNKNEDLEALSGNHTDPDFSKFIKEYSNDRYLKTLNKLVEAYK